MSSEFQLPKHCCDYCIIHGAQRKKKSKKPKPKDLASNRNKIPKPNKIPKEPQATTERLGNWIPTKKKRTPYEGVPLRRN